MEGTQPGSPRLRYGWHMRFLAIFMGVALLEIMTFLWVGSQIGLGWALGIALTTALIGSALVRRAGVSVLRQIRVRLDQGGLPGRELSHGAAILVAGALLISPGFITDVVGFTLLVPRVRDMIHRTVVRRFKGRVRVVSSGFGGSDENGDVIDVEGWE